MPVAKIHVLEGRYDEGRLGRVSNAVQILRCSRHRKRRVVQG
jgi:hypothetical protein